MFKDITRWTKTLNIPFKMNPYFPILTVPHMRGAVLAQKNDILENYMQVMFESIWTKAMNLNDLCFFYHTGKEKKIVGINMKIASVIYDPTY